MVHQDARGVVSVLLWWLLAVLTTQPRTSVAFASSRLRITRTITILALSSDDDALAQALQKSNPKSAAWWSDQETLPFDCTACGKCCKTLGSVWMTPDEVQGAAALLDVSVSDFIVQYASHTLSTRDDDDDDVWVQLKNTKQQACTFLDLDTNQCRIYSARPAQCATYPFWPKIMASESTWNDEVRVPDDDDVGGGPYWTAKGGGCEGMRRTTNDDDAMDNESSTSTQEARIQLEEYEWQERRFPFHTEPKPVNASAMKKKND